MGDLFVHIYDFFERRRALLWCTLVVTVGVLALFAGRMRFDEQLTNFFPDDEGGSHRAMIFEELRMMDKVAVMFSSPDPDRSIECAERFEALFAASEGVEYVRSVTSAIDGGQITAAVDVIYDNLPVYLTDGDYRRLDSLMAGDGVERTMAEVRGRLTSPMGIALRDVVLRDPLGIATGKLAALQDFSSIARYEIYDGHLFSPGLETMLVVIEPTHGIGDTGANGILVSAIEECAARVRTEGFDDVQIEYMGGPSVAVHNARRVKADTALTLGIALVVTVLFIALAFRNRRAIILITLPVGFGALFALGTIWLMGQHTISAIATGAGAAVMGVALSYSIHVVAHCNHTSDPRQIIRELAWPLTVGSFTTIGAFLGLLFTDSALLRDFGLFAALTLVGTTLFCLVVLPHMLGSARSPDGAGRVQHLVEKISGYAWDRNRVLVGAVLVITLVCLFFYGRVRFDSDMMNLSYMPPRLKAAEQRLNSFSPGEGAPVLLVATGPDFGTAHGQYVAMGELVTELQREGLVERFVSAADMLLPPSVADARVGRWKEYWSGGRRKALVKRVEESAAAQGFRAGAFDGFVAMLGRDYSSRGVGVGDIPVFLSDWVSVADDGTVMLMANVSIGAAHKDEVYGRIAASQPGVVIVDRAYFASQMARSVSDDFNLVLLIASALIFVALLISYGRIELALMAFMPMAVSWVIILGLMAILGIEFNIVNIILSTFIFGIGDDFSIFIMDGLLSEYRSGRKVLAAHKTTILFSAFTVLVGLGVLVFARHPAMHSIAGVSIVGMAAVISVSYILQPLVFRTFISSQTRRGGFPWTLGGLLNSLYAFLYFLVGCAVLQTIIVTILHLPVGAARKKLWFHRSVCLATGVFLRTMITTRRVSVNEGGENFEKPAVIVANHQSFIDILIMLSLHPKMVMVTNSWVWRSPFFGRIVRYGDFYHAADGYDRLADTLRDKVRQGYSVVVFPEGTRSADGRLGRFHKGAFYLAEKLGLDVLPVVLYGTGLVSSKRQPFYIKKGLLVSKVLPRIATAGLDYRVLTKRTAEVFRREYGIVYEEYNRACNPYFRDALIKNYTYKGPVLEWYMRIKLRLEGNYEVFDRTVPREGYIVDIGCGYGGLANMLAMLSEGRRVLGIDYDEEKIAVARHGFLRSERVRFAVADAVRYDPPAADGFILSDVLHYLDHEAQDALLARCFARTAEGGTVIVRDGDSSEERRHRTTERTEKWSTRIVKFNKTAGELYFTNGERIRAAALRAGFGNIEVIDGAGSTSNKIYIIRRG